MSTVQCRRSKEDFIKISECFQFLEFKSSVGIKLSKIFQILMLAQTLFPLNYNTLPFPNDRTQYIFTKEFSRMWRFTHTENNWHCRSYMPIRKDQDHSQIKETVVLHCMKRSRTCKQNSPHIYCLYWYFLFHRPTCYHIYLSHFPLNLLKFGMISAIQWNFVWWFYLDGKD